MDFKAIEKKWQAKWEKDKINNFDKKNIDKKHYVLEMFSYPSAAKLHVGHWYNYGPTDSYARYKRMKGFEIFQPMGFDAFGLPAENYAIKTGIHPQDSTEKNIELMEQTLREMGAMFDWSNEIKTCMPDYYKWTQWLFLQLYKKGLAYRKEAPVNWCPDCQTVLANEQVIQGQCERCHSTVIQKDLTQWFFKITDYAEELLTGLDGLDWPEKTKAMQRNWIGKSVGGEIIFKGEDGNHEFKVFTTRADTVFGVSYVVLAPEHPLVKEITTEEQLSAVQQYVDDTAKTKEIERLSLDREKTGVFTGAYCINPVNGKKVPIWISDYVLYSYGTGCVMGVPAHDDRDFAFANKYQLPITRVIKGTNGVDDTLPFTGDGILVNSVKYDGLTPEEGRKAILADLSMTEQGGFKVNYRLRDWLVSRQRYWGAPIPVIHCDKCGIVPVPEEDLPVKLPYDVEFKPDGKSPLAKCEKFINTKCPICGGKAHRDPDTLDTFVCSSWYFLRYPDAHNSKEPFNSELINQMLPVDKYVGGAEHACMHLLYSRFITKALRDMGYLNFDEPFKSLVHQGVILGPDGNRMSKSRGNVISPDDYVREVGSDVFRTYLMFGFSYTEGGPWNDGGIKSIAKFLDRIEKIVTSVNGYKNNKVTTFDRDEKELNYSRNYTIKCVDRDMEAFSFNTALARLMEYVSAIYKYDTLSEDRKNVEFMKDCIKDLVLLISPFAPHFGEELWQIIGNKKSVFTAEYPKFDEKALIKDEIELAVQINSKVKAKINVSSDATEKDIEQVALASESIIKALEGKQVRKVIVIKGRLVNIIAG
ncbi:MAG: leucine--tRNA ligase [Clostridiales bacterium]|nr:leucine--tRNA ligase [Clostridiales bacterium]